MPPNGGHAPGAVLNDVHSQLNPTAVSRVDRVASLSALQGAIRAARRRGDAVSIAGGRHAMGGQQFGSGTVHLDTRPMRRVLALDPETGLLEVEAGIHWDELVAWTAANQPEPARWGIAQKQTGANRITVGGSLAANVHGRGLTLRPLVADVESFTLVDARGEVRTCSRTQDAELFRLVVGGYGLFGVVHAVKLRLAPRTRLERGGVVGRRLGPLSAQARELAAMVGAFHVERRGAALRGRTPRRELERT